jgi:hypothetical protein
MNYFSDRGCWAEREEPVVRAWLKEGTSDVPAKREEDGSGPARLGVGGGSGGAGVRLLRLGRF